jgi:hypothetical protein
MNTNLAAPVQQIHGRSEDLSTSGRTSREFNQGLAVYLHHRLPVSTFSSVEKISRLVSNCYDLLFLHVTYMISTNCCFLESLVKFYDERMHMGRKCCNVDQIYKKIKIHKKSNHIK